MGTAGWMAAACARDVAHLPDRARARSTRLIPPSGGYLRFEFGWNLSACAVAETEAEMCVAHFIRCFIVNVLIDGTKANDHESPFLHAKASCRRSLAAAPRAKYGALPWHQAVPSSPAMDGVFYRMGIDGRWSSFVAFVYAVRGRRLDGQREQSPNRSSAK